MIVKIHTKTLPVYINPAHIKYMKILKNADLSLYLKIIFTEEDHISFEEEDLNCSPERLGDELLRIVKEHRI